MPRIVDQSPNPKSHIKTLMRIGYTLESAAADIIDNSLAAKARQINIYSPPGLELPILSISDDGCGMTLKELQENMRIGCKDPTEERAKGDLGRFGSGMKTASFSQARQLTVVTRTAGGPLVAARWDIDRIEETNSWCLEVFEGDEVLQLAGAKPDSIGSSGTQIIWRKLTCLESGNHAGDADVELATRLSSLSSYLALHFHRFMSGANKCEFRLNGTLITPVDPFLTGEPGYQEGPSARHRCKGGHIQIKTHVLPHFNKMTKKAIKNLGGAGEIAQNQGLYIYRERRLIMAGGWLGMSHSNQLSALARIQVDIPSALDNDWSTDVKKASLQIPPKVKRELKKFMSDPVKRSKRVHKYRGKLEEANRYWNIREDETTGKITYEPDIENTQLCMLIKRTDKEQRKALVDYLKQLAVSLPINHIYEKMAERPKDVGQSDADLAAIDELLNKVF